MESEILSTWKKKSPECIELAKELKAPKASETDTKNQAVNYVYLNLPFLGQIPYNPGFWKDPAFLSASAALFLAGSAL